MSIAALLLLAGGLAIFGVGLITGLVCAASYETRRQAELIERRRRYGGWGR